ncbi:hypothetical protein [Streptomyces sp. NPDC056663]|uniref:hypothetical protein n=1 Tax=unclassified Streptomyces TaxID=2593676 RepID=UPI003634B166
MPQTGTPHWAHDGRISHKRRPAMGRPLAAHQLDEDTDEIPVTIPPTEAVAT